jgi:hypothetical protein
MLQAQLNPAPKVRKIRYILESRRPTFMKLILFCIALIAGPSGAAQNVVRLPPHVSEIAISDGGKTIELLDSAPTVSLPQQPPHMSINGAPWYVDVRNLGPHNVTLQGNHGFAIPLKPGQGVHIRTVVTGYVVTAR